MGQGSRDRSGGCDTSCSCLRERLTKLHELSHVMDLILENCREKTDEMVFLSTNISQVTIL
jgi:hypothetical protein